jgi:DNA-directed RNA polymerase specialized sigma24 family protein
MTPLCKFFAGIELALMRSPYLHFIDTNGDAVSPAIKSAVEAAFRWALTEYPDIDSALLANFAERLAKNMQANIDSITSIRRYAYAGMHGKVRDWLKNKTPKEITVGLGQDLDGYAGVTASFQGAVDRAILFEQLRSKLSARDRYILVLLVQQNATPTDVAAGLGISYSAATKAIQRVRERIATALDIAKSKKDLAPGMSTSKGLRKEWI